jgi:hypothetical protein
MPGFIYYSAATKIYILLEIRRKTRWAMHISLCAAVLGLPVEWGKLKYQSTGRSEVLRIAKWTVFRVEREIRCCHGHGTSYCRWGVSLEFVVVATGLYARRRRVPVIPTGVKRCGS